MIENPDYICTTTQSNIKDKVEDQIKKTLECIETYKDDPDQVYAFNSRLEKLKFTLNFVDKL